MVHLSRYFLLLSFTSSCLLITVTLTFPPPTDLSTRNLPQPNGLYYITLTGLALGSRSHVRFFNEKLYSLATSFTYFIDIASNAGVQWLVAHSSGKTTPWRGDELRIFRLALNKLRQSFRLG